MLHSQLAQLESVQRMIASCRTCPKMVGPPVHGPAMETSIFLLGQAPGPHEGKKGRPFAHTAGKTLFRWFEESAGVNETAFRDRIYMAAVARCFPGKASVGGGDRIPDTFEIENCSLHLKRELALLHPKLLIAVGRLAITQALGPKSFGAGARLSEVVGKTYETKFYGYPIEVVCLPHPSGLSSWHKTEPGKSMLLKALHLIRNHRQWRETFGSE